MPILAPLFEAEYIKLEAQELTSNMSWEDFEDVLSLLTSDLLSQLQLLSV